MRKKNGFTLVELLSTIVILGIIVSITVYLVMKNINSAKEDTKLIAYNNIKTVARSYTDEVSSYWNTSGDYEYSCISLGNMIELGYFNEDTINKYDDLNNGTMIKIVRDKDSKVIKETSFSFEDSILSEVDCGYQSGVSISSDDMSKKVQSVNIKILYNTLGDDYYRYFYLTGFSENTISTSDKVYSCNGIGDCSNDLVSNLEGGHWYLADSDVIRINTKSNGSIAGFIYYNGESIAEVSKTIEATYDNIAPTISVNVYKIASYDGSNPKSKGDLITSINSDYNVGEWVNYGYWFEISANEDSTIKWSYNNTNKVNGSLPSTSGSDCNTTCSKTLSGDGNRLAIIEAIDEAGNSSQLKIDIKIDRTAPTIDTMLYRCSSDSDYSSLITSGETNTTVTINSKVWAYNGINIKYDVKDSISDVKEVRVLQNASGIYDVLSTNMVSNEITSSSGNIKVFDSGRRYIQIEASDNAGNVSTLNVIGYLSNVITVDYDANGGSGAPVSQNKVYSTDITLSSTKPTRKNYVFASWNTKSDGSGTSYSPGATYSNNDSITLYAMWTVNGYSINYNLNGGTKGIDAPTSGESGSIVSVSNPTKTGYTFTGWTVSGTGASISGTSLTIGSSDITLTANWKANKVYINFDVNGGTIAASTGSNTWSVDSDGIIYHDGTKYAQSINYDESLTSDGLANYNNSSYIYITKSGYSIPDGEEWICKSGCITENKVYNQNTVYKATDFCDATNGNCTVILKANWNISTYTISYNLNGGAKGSNAPTSGESGSTVSVSNPTKTGYTFIGWTVLGTGASISGTSLTIGTSDITLSANWEKLCTIPTFTYTGNYQIVDDSDNVISDVSSYVGDFKIRFLSSGTLTITDLGCAVEGIDAFIVGGGGNGANGSTYTGQQSVDSGGGGGGAAITVLKLPISTGTKYAIVVGGATKNSSFGVEGTAYFTALAGSTPTDPTYISDGSGWKNPVGSGGSGRLSGQTGLYNALSVIVKQGASGNGSDGNYEFNETGNKRYGAGGSQGTGGVSTGIGGTATTPSAGGSSGGGKGGQGCSYAYDNSLGKYALSGGYAGSAATANTGSGGGGGGGKCGSGSTNYGSAGSGGSGASGIVIIRNTRASYETNPPVCSLSADSTTITAIATDDMGISYQGWSNTYSGSSSSTKAISTGTHTYYVVDTSGNKSSCSITITNTELESTEERTSAYEKWNNGTCTCRGASTSNGYPVVQPSCNAKTCPCPSGMWQISVCSSVHIGYYCSSGETLSGSVCIRTTQVASCPSGYTKIDDNYCYKK